MLKDFARYLQWTADDVLDGMTLAEFWGRWCGGAGKSGGHDPDRLRDQINRRRAARGLPPMKPNPGTGNGSRRD